LRTNRKDDLEPYWQDEKDRLCTIEFLPQAADFPGLPANRSPIRAGPWPRCFEPAHLANLEKLEAVHYINRSAAAGYAYEYRVYLLLEDGSS
jgi:hypothetical protein